MNCAYYYNYYHYYYILLLLLWKLICYQIQPQTIWNEWFKEWDSRCCVNEKNRRKWKFALKEFFGDVITCSCYETGEWRLLWNIYTVSLKLDSLFSYFFPSLSLSLQNETIYFCSFSSELVAFLLETFSFYVCIFFFFFYLLFISDECIFLVELTIVFWCFWQKFKSMCNQPRVEWFNSWYVNSLYAHISFHKIICNGWKTKTIHWEFNYMSCHNLWFSFSL